MLNDKFLGSIFAGYSELAMPKIVDSIDSPKFLFLSVSLKVL